MIEPRAEPARVLSEERRNVKNVPDEVIFRRLSLYNRIDAENLARISACREELISRYPEIATTLEVDEVIEDVLREKRINNV